MTAAFPFPDLTAPIPAAGASDETLATVHQDSAAAEAFALLLDTCLVPPQAHGTAGTVPAPRMEADGNTPPQPLTEWLTAAKAGAHQSAAEPEALVGAVPATQAVAGPAVPEVVEDQERLVSLVAGTPFEEARQDVPTEVTATEEEAEPVAALAGYAAPPASPQTPAVAPSGEPEAERPATDPAPEAPRGRSLPQNLPPAAVEPRQQEARPVETPTPARRSAEFTPAPQPAGPQQPAPVADPAPHPLPWSAELARLIQQVRAVVTAHGSTEGEAWRPAPPASEMAFAARLSQPGAQHSRAELLAALASPELALRTSEAAPRTPAPALEASPAPAAEAPESPAPETAAGDTPDLRRAATPEKAPEVTEEAAQHPGRKVEPAEPGASRRASVPAPPRGAAEDDRPRGLAVARGRTWRELPTELRTVPRATSVLGHPVFAETRNTPAAPYRAPEFVATQPGARTPWSAPADPPIDRAEVPRTPLHELSMVIPARTGEAGKQEAVQLRVVERAGEVKVAVHTRDTELAQSLREQLGDLVQRLERSGYHTETWKPGEPHLEGVRQQDLPSERDSAGGRHGDQPGSGHHPSRQQRQRQQDQPHWAESLAAAGLGHGPASEPGSRRS